MNALAWLTWRQHRWSISGASALALLAAYGLLQADLNDGMHATMPLMGFYGVIVQTMFGAVIGMFWGAPLLARELEERTYFVAWGQDVTPVNWLRGKLIVLGAIAAVLAVPIGIGDGYGGGDSESWSMFEASPVVQIGYALLGLSIGVLAGLLTRHTLTAMAATLVFYTMIRAVLAVVARDHYLPGKRLFGRWDQISPLPGGALQTGDGFIGPDLKPVPVTEYCDGFSVPSSCMRTTKSASGTYVDYQPIDRLGLFRFFEFGVCVLIAAAALFLTFRLLRRGGGWRPSRSHRRDVAKSQSTAAITAVQVEG